MIMTSETGRTVLDRVCTSAVGFLESIDGHGFSLSLPLSEKLVQKGLVLAVGDAQSASLFPKQQLFCPRQEGVSEVKFQRSTVSVSVGDGVDDVVAGYLVRSVLDHVPEHEGFIVAQMALVEVGLNGAGDFLESVFALCALNFFEMASRFPGHARTDHKGLWDLPVIERIGWNRLKYPMWSNIYSY